MEEAKKLCRAACFQATIEKDGTIVASYCPISGIRYWDRKYAA